MRKVSTALGSALRHARLQRGLSQSEVGRRAGASRQLVSRIANGHHSGEIAAVVAVAGAVGRRLVVADEVALNDCERAAADLMDVLDARPTVR